MRSVRIIIMLMILVYSATAANATMIGDFITIRRLYPDLSTDYRPSVSTTVTAGTGDVVSPQAYLYLINIESEDIYIDFITHNGFLGGSNIFDGLQFNGFDEDIYGVSIVEATGIAIQEMTFTSNSINLNLYNMFDAGSRINLHVDTTPIPEPGTLLLIGSGLAGFAALRRRIKGGMSVYTL